MIMKIFVAVVIVLEVLVTSCAAIPSHASCHIEWNFGESCSAVQSALVSQIKKWNGTEGCASGGEKCLYSLVSVTTEVLKATHATPKKHYIDDLTFNFNAVSTKSCDVKGYSTSETWYALLDYGTNYCNLRNLIDGAGLNKAPGFRETTSNDICTQYSSHDCTVY
ncbi:uncharacterized protein [Watersipora subatra]|uniref:uncharacterized protein n=1 Tax=Watersipora subatra TaxID=2589382 RepID=UPI00355BEADE